MNKIVTCDRQGYESRTISKLSWICFDTYTLSPVIRISLKKDSFKNKDARRQKFYRHDQHKDHTLKAGS